MSNPDKFSSFAKGQQKVEGHSGKNAIIYTRVSSKEQTENLSLGVQLKGCELYATKNNLLLKGVFGGTYESAQTDERNEFKRMVSFAKNYKGGISFIIVYSLERFSRTGENAIWLSRQLRELGITILSVTQPIDTSNPAGVLQQNILFLFSQYDNDLRKQKCMDGMREKLLKGEWLTTLPLGYSYDRSGGKREYKVIINEKGFALKKAFEMKVHDGLSNTEIHFKLKKMGVSLSRQRLADLFRNPFYCGFIVNKMLQGKVVKGKHPELISEEFFLKANGIVNAFPHRYRQAKESNDVPLRKFIYCSVCNTPLTGYVVKKKNLWYYKCNTYACRCNKSAKFIHEKFQTLLSKYVVEENYTTVLKTYLRDLYYASINVSADSVKEFKTRIADVNSKLYTLEERFAFGEVAREVYEKVADKLKTEKANLEEELSQLSITLSNPSETIAKTVKMVSKINYLWDARGYREKRKLQELVFPKGIIYDREINDYRTIEVNEIFSAIGSFSSDSGNNKGGQSKNFLDLSALVPQSGIEPAHLTVHDFESRVSTGFTTSA